MKFKSIRVAYTTPPVKKVVEDGPMKGREWWEFPPDAEVSFMLPDNYPVRIQVTQGQDAKTESRIEVCCHGIMPALAIHPRVSNVIHISFPEFEAWWDGKVGD